jgi:excisionase family DNA binding protein
VLEEGGQQSGSFWPATEEDLAQLLGVSPQQMYKMAAKGEIPSFKIANAVRFDPHETAEWLREKYPVRSVELRFPLSKRA